MAFEIDYDKILRHSSMGSKAAKPNLHPLSVPLLTEQTIAEEPIDKPAEEPAIPKRPGLVVLFGWMGSKPRTVAKYKQIFAKYGFDTKIYCASLDKITFNIIGLTKFVQRNLSQINKYYQENRNTNANDNSEEAPLLFAHVLSNGGGFQFAKMNQLIMKNREKYGDIKFDGIIFDSSPGKTGQKRLLIGVGITVSNALSSILVDGKCCNISPICCIIKYGIFWPLKWILMFIIFGIIWPIVVLFGVLYVCLTCEAGFILSYFEYINFGLGSRKINNYNKWDGTIGIAPSLHITTEYGVDLMCPQKHTDDLIEMKKKFCDKFNITVIEDFDGVDHDNDTNNERRIDIDNDNNDGEKKNDDNNNDSNIDNDNNNATRMTKDDRLVLPIMIHKKVFENSVHVTHYKLYKEEYSQIVERFVDYCIKRRQLTEKQNMQYN